MNKLVNNPEIWKKIEGTDHYFISSHGRVKKVFVSKQKSPYKKALDRDVFLKPGKTIVAYNPGYFFVRIRIYGELKSLYNHRLVAQHFIPNPNNLPQVNHKDGNPHNNHLRNLEWVTPKQNIHHAWDLGLAKKRSKNWNQRIDKAVVNEVHRLRNTGLPQTEIARIIRVHQSTISLILNKKKHFAAI